MPIIYGFPLDEQEQDSFPTHASAEYVLPSASVSFPYTPAGAEFCENVNASIIPFMDSNEFFDFIDIMAQEEEVVYQNAVEVAVTASPVAMPIASLQPSEVCSAYPFAVTEAQYYAPYSYGTEEEKKEIEYLPDACVQVFPPCSEIEKEKVDSFESVFGAPIQAKMDETKDLNTIELEIDRTAEWKLKRRQEAIARWRLKKQKRKNLLDVGKISIDIRPSSLNARQQAASKRTRENGKFKRNQIKWVTASNVL